MPVYQDKNTGNRFAAEPYEFFDNATLDGLREWLQNNRESFNITSAVTRKLKNDSYGRNEQIWMLSYEDKTDVVTRDEYESRYQ